MNRVRISDSAHAMTLTAYALSALTGAMFQSGVASASILEERWPHLLYAVWASVMLLSGAACLVAAIITPRLTDPRNSLRTELLGCLGLAATLGCYEWSLLQRGPGFAVTTQALVLALGLGSVGRAIQILLDLLRLRRAFKTTEG